MMEKADVSRAHSLGWKDPTTDFEFLNALFEEIGHRVSKLKITIATLASIAGNHHGFKTQSLSLETYNQSASEAKSIKSLTILGIAFIPLAYVSSLFSISGPYAPGNGKFWLYIAVSLPLTGTVLLTYYLLRYNLANTLSGRWRSVC